MSGGRGELMTSPPLEKDLGPPADEDWEKGSIGSIPSTVGAVHDKKEHGSLITKSFEKHIGGKYGNFAKAFAGNKIPHAENLEDFKNTPWSEAWNNTMRMLKKPIKDLIHNSKEWPDNGFGGKRCVKQLLEILVLDSYVKIVCDTISKDLHRDHNIQKQKISVAYANFSIDPSDEDLRRVESLSKEISELSRNHKRLTQDANEITRNIIDDFFNNTIKTNTIKSASDQEIVNGFVENPTVERFQKLCCRFWQTSWRAHAHKQFDGWNKFADEMEVQEVNECSNEPQLKRKRINHSEEEKLKIKQKTGCKCVGLPIGLPTCPNLGIKRSPVMLTHEHRIPVSLDGQTALQMSLEDEKNRWGMCPECDKKKTHYIDPIIRKHKDNFELMQNYLNDYTLPQQIIEEIKLNIFGDDPEAKKRVKYEDIENTTGNTIALQ